MNDINWTELKDLSQIEEIDQLSQTTPVVVFKHSTRCSISAASLNRLERKWDGAKSQNVKPYFLDLLAHRDISNALAEHYGVMHQSPQVLLIFQGKCIYTSSHFEISFEQIIENIPQVTL